MGDAFTAVSDDSFTLFYNPAALGRNRSDFYFSPLNVTASGTNILGDLDKFNDFPSEPVDVADLILNYPVHASVGTAPGFKLFNFGVSFIVNDSYDLILRNQIHPMLELDLRSDRGVVFGGSYPIGTHRLNKKSKTGHQTSIGLGAKYIERTGVNDSLSLTGPTVLEAITQDEVSEIVNSLGKVKGRGWGFDAGIEHVSRTGPLQFVFGLAALDVTGTEFKVEENEHDLKVSNLRDQINLGASASMDWKLFNFGASADVRSLNEQIDFGKRLRLGAHAGIPGFKVMAGVNSGYYSYGFSLDLFLLELTAGFYDVELGSNYKQTKSKRFLLYLSLFDFSFDS
jgi:hypothetical protein